MSIDDVLPVKDDPNAPADRKAGRRIDLDRHSPRYRQELQQIAEDLHARCPVAWNEQHGGYWYASGNSAVFDIARRADVLSNDHDVRNERRGYKGITIPAPAQQAFRGGFLEMGPAGAAALPAGTQPVPVPGRGGPVGAGRPGGDPGVPR